MEPTFVVRSRILLEYPSLLKCRTQWRSFEFNSNGCKFSSLNSNDFPSSYVLLHFFISGFVPSSSSAFHNYSILILKDLPSWLSLSFGMDHWVLGSYPSLV